MHIVTSINAEFTIQRFHETKVGSRSDKIYGRNYLVAGQLIYVGGDTQAVFSGSSYALGVAPKSMLESSRAYATLHQDISGRAMLRKS